MNRGGHVRLVIDMNLSPQWCDFLGRHGHEAVHWSEVGNVAAPDSEVMIWARMHERVVFTHDLDFGIALALSGEAGPSVIQLREQDVTPEAVGDVVSRAISQFSEQLAAGALVTIDRRRNRATVLPIRR